MKFINIIKPQKSHGNVYLNNIFVSLDSKCKQIIYKSNFDIQKSFLVGKNSLERSNKFPQNKNVGIKFIEHSIKKGSQDALYYYTKLLVTRNNLILQDFKKADQLVKKYSDENDPRFYLINGLIYRHQKNLKKAICKKEIQIQCFIMQKCFILAMVVLKTKKKQIYVLSLLNNMDVRNVIDN